MLSKIAADNLKKDGKVLGEKWFQTYGGWFSDRENMQIFTDSIIRGCSLRAQHDLEILYVGSASGELGEQFVRALGGGHLTLVDVAEEHLKLNTNPATTKLCMDVLGMNLNKKFDIVMMRSFLDYFPTMNEQIAVLKVVKEHLRPGGLFINQPASIPTAHARNVISRAYCSVPNIGKRLFQSWDIGHLYASAGLGGAPFIYGDGKIMRITEQDHIARYAITPTDIVTLQTILKDAERSVEITKNGYTLSFEFPILAKFVQ